MIIIYFWRIRVFTKMYILFFKKSITSSDSYLRHFWKCLCWLSSCLAPRSTTTAHSRTRCGLRSNRMASNIHTGHIGSINNSFGSSSSSNSNSKRFVRTATSLHTLTQILHMHVHLLCKGVRISSTAGGHWGHHARGHPQDVQTRTCTQNGSPA